MNIRPRPVPCMLPEGPDPRSRTCTMASIAPSPLSDDQAVSAAALRTFFNIAAAWSLSEDQAMALLGLTARSTFSQWRRDPDTARLSHATLERLSYLFGIYRALQILLPTPQAADAWLHRPNQAAPFQGASALERMRSGRLADLAAVRQYLDAQCG